MRFLLLILLGFKLVYSQDCNIPRDPKFIRENYNSIFINANSTINHRYDIFVSFDPILPPPGVPSEYPVGLIDGVFHRYGHISVTLPLTHIDEFLEKTSWFYIRSNCGNGQVTHWVGPFAVRPMSDGHTPGNGNSSSDVCSGYSNDGVVDKILNTNCNKNIPIVQSNKHNIQVLEELIFEFDEAGNQLKVRGDEIGISSSEKLNREEEKEDWALHFQLAPNPTKGEVILSWDKKVDKLIAEMYLYPINGAYKIPIKFINSSLSSRINMASYTPGQYIVSILLKNGNKINKYIIRAL